eukprot:TRINITY_DN12033_c0_g2_i2.p1 TRINITY_DN12033_c0_g2~~TRINITY_DN12033_c0_g2_i2.p1  ORF type:complete len:554 (-),score=84.41 TRINITY_DN12033_c0_g2_i2:199-1860(-)
MTGPPRQWSYEEVAGEHVSFEHYLSRHFSSPRSMRGRMRIGAAEGRNGEDEDELAFRFVRTALLMTPKSCFNSSEAYHRCCHRGQSTKPQRQTPPPEECFSIQEPEALCCGKELFWSHVFTSGNGWHQAMTDQASTSSSSSPRRSNQEQAGANTDSTAAGGCSALRALQVAGIVSWMQGLLALPKAQQAPCAAGSLADRLGTAPVYEALEAMHLLREAVLKECPGRRALAVFRRSILMWEHRFLGPELGQHEMAMRNVVVRILTPLEACRRALPPAPVVHLHVPKTAGTALCTWANATGFRSRHLPGARCQLPGDGPFWLGDRAAPASCAQRVREMARANVSWVSVERWLDLPLCDDLQYVVALRAPVARTLHHFLHLLSYFINWRYDLTDIVELAAVVKEFFAKLWRLKPFRSQLRDQASSKDYNGSFYKWPATLVQLGDWLDFWMGLASNYQVRSLAGAAAGEAYLEETEAVDSLFKEMNRLAAASALACSSPGSRADGCGHCSRPWATSRLARATSRRFASCSRYQGAPAISFGVSHARLTFRPRRCSKV